MRHANTMIAAASGPAAGRSRGDEESGLEDPTEAGDFRARRAGRAGDRAGRLADRFHAVAVGSDAAAAVAAEAAERLPRRVDGALEPDALQREGRDAGEAGPALRRPGVDDESGDGLH